VQSQVNPYLSHSGAGRDLAACTGAHLALGRVRQAANHGQPFHLGDACVDITRHKQLATALCLYDATLEQRISEWRALVERRNRELEQFADAAFYELKSSLRAMLHLANWIGEDTVATLPEPSKEHLAKLHRRITRMDLLLDDLLAYASAERQRYPLERVDTVALVQEVVELLAVPSSFTVTIERTLPIIAAERMPLAVVFRNLIENILKRYPQPPAGHMSISAHMAGSWIEFRIIDDGSDSDPTFHERIFQIFQALKSCDQRERSGLGLVVIKKLVESRGGAIEVKAMAGCSASFRFTWPKEPAPHL